MKMQRWLGLALLSSLGWGMISGGQAANAFRFQQAEMDQQRVVAIAAPIGSGVNLSRNLTHQLLILEQISNTRACWREFGQNPVTIDPLLLNFDFTGICARSTDSNGYSIRVAGQDLGLQYSLRLVTRGNDLVLVGIPNTRPNATPLEIGRTYGIPNGFGKIILNPGWRMTRRVYNGQAVGHVYLTNDQALPGLIAAAPTPPPTTVQPTPIAPRPGAVLPPPPPIRTSRPPSNVPSTPPSNGPLREIEYTAAPNPPNRGTLPTLPATNAPRPSASALGFNYRVVVATANPTLQDRVKALIPDSFRTRLNGQVVMQAGLFRERQAADELQQRLRQAELPAMVLPIR